MTDDEDFEGYDEYVTLSCPNCGDVGCSGWYVLDPIKDARLRAFIGFRGAFCSAECVCEYLDIPFYNDDEVPDDDDDSAFCSKKCALEYYDAEKLEEEQEDDQDEEKEDNMQEEEERK